MSSSKVQSRPSPTGNNHFGGKQLLSYNHAINGSNNTKNQSHRVLAAPFQPNQLGGGNKLSITTIIPESGSDSTSRLRSFVFEFQLNYSTPIF